MFALFLGILLPLFFNLKQKKAIHLEYQSHPLTIGHIDAKMAAEYTKWKYHETKVQKQ